MNRRVEQCHLLGVAPNAIERRHAEVETLELIARRQPLRLRLGQAHRHVARQALDAQTRVLGLQSGDPLHELDHAFAISARVSGSLFLEPVVAGPAPGRRLAERLVPLGFQLVLRPEPDRSVSMSSGRRSPGGALEVGRHVGGEHERREALEALEIDVRAPQLNRRQAQVSRRRVRILRPVRVRQRVILRDDAGLR